MIQFRLSPKPGEGGGEPHDSIIDNNFTLFQTAHIFG